MKSNPLDFKANILRLGLMFGLSISFAYGQQSELDSLEKVNIGKQFQTIDLSKNRIKVPVIKNYQVQLVGSDNKAVIDLEGNIHQPLVSKNVNLLFKVTRKKDKAVAEIPVKDLLVGGKYGNTGTNKEPFVIPSLREWHGENGKFTLSKTPKIVIDQASNKDLTKVAELLKEDLKKLINIDVNISSGQAGTGDIYLTNQADKSLGEEGYSLKIDDVFQISASDYKGAIFGTRTLLQLLAQNPLERSIPQGESRDYPSYEVRGIVLGVGRKFFSIDFLDKYVEFLSYYKMSNFHIHLNDNGFHKYFNFDWDKTQSGFRLENDTYPGLTSKDGHYSKKEFIALQEKALRYGITIIPEIDVPAHSLAIVKAVPEIGSDKYGRDHLDLSNPKTKEVVKNIFNEYITGPNPVFIGKEVHIGTDEYDKHEAERFRDFTDFLIKQVQSAGKDVRAWGALTHAQGTTPVKVEGVKLNMWYNGFADPIAMKKLGYKQISTPDGLVYMVPAAGYYHDFLNTDYLYNNWEPRNVADVTFEKGDPTVIGGMFALWNDIAGNGISEYDAHLRIFPAMQILSEKMWSAADSNPSLFDFNNKRKQLTEGPGLNMLAAYQNADPLLLNYTFEDNLKNDGSLITSTDAKSTGVRYVEGKSGKAISFTDKDSYIESPIPAIGTDYTVSFWIKPEKHLMGELFKSKDAVVFATEKGIAYSRDGYTFELGDIIPVSEWSFVTVTADKNGAQFYVNGKLSKDMKPEEIVLPYKDKAGKEVKYTMIKTLQFPLEKISIANAQLDELRVYNRKLNPSEVLSSYRY